MCQNHQGDIDLLRLMVERAAEAGAWACKIQTFYAHDLSPYWQADRDRMRKLELGAVGHNEFVKTCNKFNVVPMTSVYSFKYAEMLSSSGIRWIKIGSPQMANLELIRHYKMAGFKVIVSTGGHTIDEMRSIYPIEGILHCVSKYPSMPHEVNLIRMTHIANKCKGIPFGFSDHTDPTLSDWDVPSKLAMIMGATFIEKHFTVLDRADTKDGPVSITSNQLKELAHFEKIPRDIQIAEMNKDNPPLWNVIIGKQEQSEINLIARYKTR